MLLVDSSVWIDFFNGKSTVQTLYLRDHADRISHGLHLLHADRDFDAIEEHLGLQVVHP